MVYFINVDYFKGPMADEENKKKKKLPTAQKRIIQDQKKMQLIHYKHDSEGANFVKMM